MRTSIQACGDGDDDIGVAEAERRQQGDLALGLRLAHQILAGDAEMGGAGGEVLDDFGRRQKGDFDIFDARQDAAIVAGAASRRHGQAGAGEKGVGVFLQPALGRNGQNEFARSSHCAPFSRSIQIAAPTAGMSALAPSVDSSRS